MEIALGLFIAVAVISLICEYTDNSLGGGYGTILTPVLLIIGFIPLDVVPAVLLGQLVGGIVGGYFHHRVGNVHLDFRHDGALTNGKRYWLGYIPRSLDAKVILILVISGLIGGVVGAAFAINIPSIILKGYIGVMVLGIGIAMLVRRNHKGSFTFKKLAGIGVLSAFNKGISGGGYGPLITGGQVLIGRDVKNSIGSATIAEVAVCLVSFLSYVFLKGGIDWQLAAATSIGSITAGPLGALTVSKFGSNKLKLGMGLVTMLLGVFTLAGTFG
ncbi:MAG: sulfite exporter TauE/SafE family protein [Chloroflexi bacterium]|nr:sulfite exporter TauE/SafE family protein [Chloroflexota bacterium]